MSALGESKFQKARHGVDERPAQAGRDDIEPGADSREDLTAADAVGFLDVQHGRQLAAVTKLGQEELCLRDRLQLGAEEVIRAAEQSSLLGTRPMVHERVVNERGPFGRFDESERHARCRDLSPINDRLIARHVDA
jgi:hypothetical protein